MDIKEKIRELAAKHEIPPELLEEAIELERNKIVLKNRRLGPELVSLIGKHAGKNRGGE